MATKYAVLRGIQLTEMNFTGTGTRGLALCTFDTPAYTATTDADAMTFSGERDTGTDGSPTLATAIQNQIRDGKTVTLRGAICAHPGRSSAGVAFYAATLTTNPSYGCTVSAGNLLASLCSAAFVDQTTATSDAAGGHPITLAVAFDIA
jgi:hypothetical protein